MNAVDKFLCAISPAYKKRRLEKEVIATTKIRNDDAATAVFKKFIVNSEMFSTTYGEFSAMLNNDIKIDGSWGTVDNTPNNARTYYQLMVSRSARGQKTMNTVFNSEASYRAGKDFSELHRTIDYESDDKTRYVNDYLDFDNIALKLSETLHEITEALDTGKMQFDIKPHKFVLTA
jgi:hypothetical protein